MEDETKDEAEAIDALAKAKPKKKKPRPKKAPRKVRVAAKRGNFSQIPTIFLEAAAKKRLVYLATGEIAKRAGVSQETVYPALIGRACKTKRAGEAARAKVIRVLGMRP